MCVCEGAGDGVSMRACLCMHGVCGGTGVLLVTNGHVNAILPNSKTLDGYPSPSKLVSNFITNDNVPMECEQQLVLRSNAKGQRR